MEKINHVGKAEITDKLRGKCVNCKHYRPADPGEGLGACRHSPPHVSIVMVPQQNALTRQVQMGAQQMSAWPLVQEDQWCGQWAGKIALQ